MSSPPPHSPSSASASPIKNFTKFMKNTVVKNNNKAMSDILVLQASVERAGVLPPIRKTSWSLFGVICMIVSCPAIGALYLFSAMGIGTEVFKDSKIASFTVPYYSFTALGILLFLSVFDSNCWKTRLQVKIRSTFYTIVLLLFCTTVLFSAGKYPYGPLCLIVLGTPMWCMGAKIFLFKRTSFSQFTSWLPGPLFILSLGVLAYWIRWTWGGHLKEDEGNEWSIKVRNDYAIQCQCPPNFADYPECEANFDPNSMTWIVPLSGDCNDVYDNCLDSFLLWAMGFFVAVYYFFLSHMCHFVRIDDLDAAPQGFTRLIVLLIFGLWCCASLSASNGAVTNAFLAFLLFCGMSVAVIFIFVHSRKSAEKRLLSPFVKTMRLRFGQYGDWFRGAAVFCWPVGVVYVGVAVLNQEARLRHPQIFLLPLQLGGPDWPTSVLCGILDLKLLPILVGTLPVILIVVPTVLSGSFVYLADSHRWAATASAVSFSVTGLVIMAAPTIMMFHLEKAMEEEKEALDNMPDDEEVKLADEAAVIYTKLFATTTKWSKLPKTMKAVLIVGNVCMVCATYMTMGMGGLCFREFSMEDNIKEDLNGKGLSIIKGPGWVAIGLVGGGVAMLWGFQRWAGKETWRAEKGMRESGCFTVENLDGDDDDDDDDNDDDDGDGNGNGDDCGELSKLQKEFLNTEGDIEGIKIDL